MEICSDLSVLKITPCTHKSIESRVSKRSLHTPVQSSIIHCSQKVEATQVSIKG